MRWQSSAKDLGRSAREQSHQPKHGAELGLLRATARRLAMKRLPRVLWLATPAGRTAAEGAPIRWMELAENAGFREAEPLGARFARLETKGHLETEIGPGASLRGSTASAKRL